MTTGLLLTGCPTEQSYVARHSPAFQEGYWDGCANGKEMVTNTFIAKKNDTPRYKNDPEYRQGWDDGYERCFGNREMELWTRFY